MRYRGQKASARLGARTRASLILCIGLLAGRVDLWAGDKNFLWKVESPSTSVYLLGSIHLLKPDSAPLNATIDAAFAESKRLVLEIDLAREGPAKVQQLMLRRGVNLDGKTLEQAVSGETYAMATAWAKDLGLDIKMMSPLKPWVAALTMLAAELQRLGYDPNLGVDRQLAQRAKQANKPLVGLETAEFQIGLIDRLPPRLQELMLRQSLAEREQLEKFADDMVHAWRRGEVTQVEKLFLQSMKRFPELQETLIDARNRNWLPQIEELLTLDEPSLVVVGAAHLVGANGVIELLKGRGYKLEQL